MNTLILGIGNLLWADEGFGVRAVEQLNALYRFNDDVVLMDGGTQGLYLAPFVQQSDLLVIFDAIDYGLAPGTLKTLEGEDVPSFMGAKKMSLHQTGFQEVLAMAQMLGEYPDELLLVGVQPEVLEDYGGSLRPLTRSRIEPAIDLALRWLAARGVHARKREQPLPEDQSLAGAEVQIQRYERERPPPELACRIGDERVLRDPDFHLQYKPHPLEPEQVISCDVDHRGKY